MRFSAVFLTIFVALEAVNANMWDRDTGEFLRKNNLTNFLT